MITAKAMRQYRKAVTLEEENPDYLLAAGNMAHTLGDYAQAQEWLVRLVKMGEGKKNGDKCRSCAFNDLAVVYYDMGRYTEAESLWKDDLAIKEQALGKVHPKVATVLNNLAALYESQGKYAEAEPLYKHDLEISEKSLGKDHPDVARTLNNLAELYEAQEKHAEAEPLFQRALAIFKAKLPAGHPHIKKVQENYDALKEKMAGM